MKLLEIICLFNL